MQGRDLASKIIGIWWPIFGFVSLGFDHVVANMFFVPMGIWLHTPKCSVGLYIWKGIIPAGFGNIIGGALFCGAYYWYMYLLNEPDIAIDGVYYARLDGVETGMGVSTPTDDESSHKRSDTGLSYEDETHVRQTDNPNLGA